MPGKPIKKAELPEIVVSRYWPTKIIKSISIKEGGEDNYKSKVTLTGHDARYVFDQLKSIYGDSKEEKDGEANDISNRMG